MTLQKILETYNLNSNQSNNFLETDKNTDHSYIDYFYENAFLKYKDKNTILLEIGARTGASCFLWNQYFRNGVIYGVDITLELFLEKYKNIENIKIYEGNAYSKEIVEKLPQKFDIIIDDGSHLAEDQLLCLQIYIDKLNKNGILVIEDIQSEYTAINLLNYVNKNYQKCKVSIVDLRKVKNRHDDLLLVVENL